MNKPVNKRKFFSIAINVALVGLILLMLFNPASKAWVLRQLLHTGLFSAEIEKEKPQTNTNTSNDFTYRDKNGNILSTSDLRGKVVFINFWASWCPPCLAEMPAINKLVKDFEHDNRIVFVFVNEDDDVKKAENYLSRSHFSIPVMQRVGAVPPHLYTGTLPTTLILDKQGKLVFRHEGIAKYDNPEFIGQLRALL